MLTWYQLTSWKPKTRPTFGPKVCRNYYKLPPDEHLAGEVKSCPTSGVPSVLKQEVNWMWSRTQALHHVRIHLEQNGPLVTFSGYEVDVPWGSLLNHKTVKLMHFHTSCFEPYEQKRLLHGLSLGSHLSQHTGGSVLQRQPAFSLYIGTSNKSSKLCSLKMLKLWLECWCLLFSKSEIIGALWSFLLNK